MWENDPYDNEVFDDLIMEEIKTKSYQISRDYPKLPEDFKQQLLRDFKDNLKGLVYYLEFEEPYSEDEQWRGIHQSLLSFQRTILNFSDERWTMTLNESDIDIEKYKSDVVLEPCWDLFDNMISEINWVQFNMTSTQVHDQIEKVEKNEYLKWHLEHVGLKRHEYLKVFYREVRNNLLWRLQVRLNEQM